MATTRKPAPARLDRHGTEKPKTRLLAHAGRGDCVGPGTTPPFALEDVETGARTPLADPSGSGSARGRMHELEGFDSLSHRHTVYERELERLAFECEQHLELLVQVQTALTGDHDRRVAQYIIDAISKRLDVIHKLATA
jgi:hypothetical protein